MNKNRILLYFIALLFFSGCKMAQKGTSSARIENKTPQFLFQQLNDSAFKCNWFTGKLNATVDFQKKTTTFSANIRARRDSLIWVSISALGIEVVRVLITRDSLKLLDKLGAKYKFTDYDYLDKMLQINTSFDLIQDIVLGNYFDYVEIEKLNAAKVVKNQYVLTTLSKRKTKTSVSREYVNEEIWLDPTTYRVLKMFVDDAKSKRELAIEYGDFRRVDRQMFPYKTEFFRNAQEPIKVNLEYSKITLNKSQTFPFIIPENYKPRD